MLNNKGALPLDVMPTFYSSGGTRLQLPPINVREASYAEFDLREMLANAGAEFQEGSLQMTYLGKKMQLGSQIKLIDTSNSLIWEEQFFEPAAKHISSRLEAVWWMPSNNCDTKFIISNTTDAPVTATITVDGTSPGQKTPAAIQLNAHETRVLDVIRDLVGKNNGTIHTTGGVSISHTGAAGAILARMLIAKANKGFSSTMNFIDPEMTGSSKWHGAGLRLGKINNQKLQQILVARNVGSQTTSVSGKIPYTNNNGEVVSINIPPTQIAPNATKTINLQNAIDAANVPASVKDAGLEMNYTTPKGSVVMSAVSISADNNQVFQVPLYDPQRIGSSAGGYPWKADGDFTTVVYIKNDTDQPQQYIARMIYPGGFYMLGLKDLKPREMAAIDFRLLRDNQTPDSMGNTIPLNLSKGQILWSAYGAENHILNGRSEQISLTEGVSSTYDCRNCCMDSTYIDNITPGLSEVDVESLIDFFEQGRVVNCYNQSTPIFYSYGNWTSSNSTVAIISSNGLAEAMSAGEASISASWTNNHWVYMGFSQGCQLVSYPGNGSGMMMVRPPRVTFSEIGSIEKGGSKDITAMVSNRGNFQITLFLRTTNNQSTSGVTFSDGSSSKVINSNGNHTFNIKGIDASTQLNDYKIEARYDNNFYIAGLKVFTVSSLSFREDSACSGFDNNYLLVPKGGTNKVKAFIMPFGASGNFKLEVMSPPANEVSVSPATVNANEAVITIMGGNTKGNFKVNVSANQQNTSVISELNVYVRDKIDKTVIFYGVTEDGNPDTPPPSSNIPTANGLQTYLNNTWGKQANVYFTVTKGTDFEVNYDLDSDDKIDSQEPGSEPLAILNTQRDATKDFNIYFLGLGVKTLPDGRTPAAFGNNSFKALFVGPIYNGTRDYITAHEIGHLLGVPGRATGTNFLMYEVDLTSSPCKIGKDEWDVVNP